MTSATRQAVIRVLIFTGFGNFPVDTQRQRVAGDTGRMWGISSACLMYPTWGIALRSWFIFSNELVGSVVAGTGLPSGQIDVLRRFCIYDSEVDETCSVLKQLH